MPLNKLTKPIKLSYIFCLRTNIIPIFYLYMLPSEKKPFKTYKNKVNDIFAIFNGILMYGDRVVVPEVLTRKIFRDFHSRHPGICKMKAFIQSYVYWQGMDKDIEDMVKTYKNCE